MRFLIGYSWLRLVTNVFLSLVVCSNVATDPSPAETSLDIIHKHRAYEPGSDQLRGQATRAQAALSMRDVDYATVLTVTEYNYITLEVITYTPDYVLVPDVTVISYTDASGNPTTTTSPIIRYVPVMASPNPNWSTGSKIGVGIGAAFIGLLFFGCGFGCCSCQED